MIKRNFTLLIIFALLASACNQSKTPSSKTIAEPKAEKVSTKLSLDQNAKPEAVAVDMSYAEEELKEEAIEDKKVEKEIQKEKNKKEEIEHTLVKVKEKERLTKVEKVKEVEKAATEEVVPQSSEVVEEKEMEAEEKAEVLKEVIKKEVEKKAEEVKEVVFSHDVLDQLLKKYVSASGKVNYSGFKADEAKLDAYLKSLDNNPPASGWSKAKKMAYWINAYNAATIKLILKNYPVSSIMKLHGGKAWDQKWIPLGGKTYTLNNIEHDVLRPTYKDARIHFAVNCAAKSCPPLLNRAWTESNLNRYLEKQTKSFINDSKHNTISANAIEVSKIFEWYAVDFGNLIDYLNKYSDTKINANAKISYKEYNWDLNN